MKHRHYKHLTLLFLCLGVLTITFSCHKDDATITQFEEQTKKSIKATYISEQEIPSHILGYVEQKTNNTFGVSIGKRNLKLSASGINELSRDTPMGKVLTGKVVQVINEKNIKFTFKVYEPENANSIINLIVVDMGEHIVEYFIQYVFDDIEAHPKLDSGVVDMTSFTGTMIVYNNEGQQIGNVEFTNGENVDSSGSTDPCADTDFDVGNDDDDTPTGGHGSDSNDDDGVDNGQTDNTNSGAASGCEDCGNNESFDTADCIEITYLPCCDGSGGCDANADGHDSQECGGCGNGSATIVTDNCNGSSIVFKSAENPCAGDVGMLFNLEEVALKKEEIEACLGDAYDNEYFETAYPGDVFDIHEYLIEVNDCSEEALDFIEELLNNFEEGDDIDVPNEVKYNIEQKCAKEIVEKVVNNTSALSQTILGYFNQDKNYVIKYKNESLTAPAVAQTDLASSCENDICTIEVKLSNYMLQNSTDMFIAKIALHETIHATLTYMFETSQFLDQGLDPNSSSDPNYSALVKAYIEFLAEENPNQISANNINDLQHEYMTVFVDDMVNSLQVIGSSLGYSSNDPSVQTEFLTSLVWSGSFEWTLDFVQNYSLNQQEVIIALGFAEHFNVPKVYPIYNEEGEQIDAGQVNPTANQIDNTQNPCF